jgi:hypothetical protein
VVPHVAANLDDLAVELLALERDDVEGTHGVAVGEQPPRKMQAEEARAA